MSRPALLRIEGMRAHRYVNGKHTEIAAIDVGGAQDARELRQNLNWFRENGLPPEEAASAGAPEVDPESAGNIAIIRLGLALQECPPAMSPRVVEQA